MPRTLLWEICGSAYRVCFFFFNDTATTEIYTLSLTRRSSDLGDTTVDTPPSPRLAPLRRSSSPRSTRCSAAVGDRKSTRLNSSHSQISYAVFCLKKKKKMIEAIVRNTHKPGLALILLRGASIV